MELKITLQSDHDTIPLMVDLIDNPGVRAWAAHCAKLTDKREVAFQPIPGGNVTPDADLARCWPYQQSIQQALADSRYPLPLPVTAPEQVKQHHLNVWHRWFTDNTKTIDQINDYKEWAHEYHWLHELNQLVHIWERYTYEWPRTEFDTNHSIEINLWPKLDAHGFPEIESVDMEPYAQYHSFQHADLILDQAIHGKSTMQSFLDNDDPRHWDTTGHHLSHGGCKILTSTRRSEMYQSTAFRSWLNRNQIDYSDLLADFPLGNIRNKDAALMERLATPWGLTFNGRIVDFEISI